MERLKRQEGFEGNSYGVVETASKPIVQSSNTK